MNLRHKLCQKFDFVYWFFSRRKMKEDRKSSELTDDRSEKPSEDESPLRLSRIFEKRSNFFRQKWKIRNKLDRKNEKSSKTWNLSKFKESVFAFKKKMHLKFSVFCQLGLLELGWHPNDTHLIRRVSIFYVVHEKVSEFMPDTFIVHVSEPTGLGSNIYFHKRNFYHEGFRANIFEANCIDG